MAVTKAILLCPRPKPGSPMAHPVAPSPLKWRVVTVVMAMPGSGYCYFDFYVVFENVTHVPGKNPVSAAGRQGGLGEWGRPWVPSLQAPGPAALTAPASPSAACGGWY